MLLKGRSTVFLKIFMDLSHVISDFEAKIIFISCRASLCALMMDPCFMPPGFAQKALGIPGERDAQAGEKSTDAHGTFECSLIAWTEL
jgi:hypothetical protein